MKHIENGSKGNHESASLDAVTLLQMRNIDDQTLIKYSATVLKEKVQRNLPCIEYIVFN